VFDQFDFKEFPPCLNLAINCSSALLGYKLPGG